MQFSIRGGRDILETPDISRGGSTRVRDDVEVAKDLRSVQDDAKKPGTLAAAGSVAFTIKSLREMEAQFIHAWFERDVVIAPPLATTIVQPRFARTQDRTAGGVEHGPALKELVALPEASKAIQVGCSIRHARKDANVVRDLLQSAGRLNRYRRDP